MSPVCWCSLDSGSPSRGASTGHGRKQSMPLPGSSCASLNVCSTERTRIPVWNCGHLSPPTPGAFEQPSSSTCSRSPLLGRVQCSSSATWTFAGHLVHTHQVFALQSWHLLSFFSLSFFRKMIKCFDLLCTNSHRCWRIWRTCLNPAYGGWKMMLLS